MSTSIIQPRRVTRAFSMVELVIALAITTIILLATASALTLGMRSLDSTQALITEDRTADTLVGIAADARLATSVMDRTETSITFVVPDRDAPPDGQPETIRYAWKGAVASPGPIVRQFNDGPESVVVHDAHLFRVDIAERSLTGTSASGPPTPDPDSWGYFLSAPVPETPWLATGTYTGDGTDARGITGLGFAPDVVILKGNYGSQDAVIRTSTVLGDGTKPLGSGTNLLPDRIESLDDDGFTVGGHQQVNANGSSYWWVAMAESPDLVKVGTYDGNSADNRNINGIGFHPDYVIVFGENGRDAWHRSSAIPGDWSQAFYAKNGSTNRIQELHADGFQVGGSQHVNDDGVAFHYVCIQSEPAHFAVGSYTGDGADDRAIDDLGVGPEYVLIKRNGSTAGVHRPDTLGSGDLALPFNGGGPTDDSIQDLRPGGFEVGASNAVNNNGSTYYWAAFGGPPGTPDDGLTVASTTTATKPFNDQSLTLATPADTTEGDLLIAAVSTDGDETIVAPSGEGWSELAHDASDGRVTLGVWWKFAGSGEAADHRFEWGSNEQAYGWMARLTGHRATDPILAVDASGGYSDAPRCRSVETTVSNALILRIGGFDDDDVNVGDPGMPDHTTITMGESGSGTSSVSGGAAYMILPLPGNCGVADFSLTNNEEWRTVTIAIAPAP